MSADRQQEAGASARYIDPQRMVREAKAGFWPDKTIVDFFDASLASRPDDEFLVSYRSDAADPVSLSYSDLSLRTSCIAENLRRLGVERGDVVSFQIPNWWQFVAVHLACVRIGAISNPLMPIFREREVEFMVRHAGSKVLITPKTFRGFDHEELAQHILQRVSTLEHIVIIDGNGDDSFDSVLLRRSSRDAPGDQIGLQPNDIVKIMYTSGTTGEPKGVMHTSNTVLSSMKTVTSRMGLTDADVIFMPSPFAHSIGFLYGILMSIYVGARLVTMDTWDPVQAADIISRHRVSFMFGATPFLADITNLADIEQRTFDHFRLFLTAGAPVPPTLVDRATSALDAIIVPGYGMTELGLVTTVLPWSPDRGRETAGLVLPHAELRVVGKDNRELARGMEGELQCRGSSTFVGYRGRDDLNVFDKQGWFATGDLVRMDEDGYISIVGRSKDIIIRGGENIPVVEVENLMHEMPQINEVAIVGMPSERLGERSCAFVTLHEGQDLTLEQLTDFLDGRNLARQYLPEKLVIIEHMPKTPVGKVQKFKLRESLGRFRQT
ncbi:MAG: AMP-binding protein [Gammaproteobacteria bacterium]|nr:AMP-binding protein [Gammaproteobacteria bacterium]MDH3435065.1 AMP-binding protein [Gammaproteobacteria bacterium]